MIIVFEMIMYGKHQPVWLSLVLLGLRLVFFDIVSISRKQFVAPAMRKHMVIVRVEEMQVSFFIRYCFPSGVADSVRLYRKLRTHESRVLFCHARVL